MIAEGNQALSLEKKQRVSAPSLDVVDTFHYFHDSSFIHGTIPMGSGYHLLKK